jgi:hypothetical protein
MNSTSYIYSAAKLKKNHPGVTVIMFLFSHLIAGYPVHGLRLNHVSKPHHPNGLENTFKIKVML